MRGALSADADDDLCYPEPDKDFGYRDGRGLRHSGGYNPPNSCGSLERVTVSHFYFPLYNLNSYKEKTDTYCASLIMQMFVICL